MEFSEKLVTLMNIYRISNSKVANGVKVDPSLISRWKSGERLPAKGSNTEAALAAFLSAQNMLPTDRRVLTLTLGQPCDTPEQTFGAIRGWLLDPDAAIAPLSTDSMPHNSESPDSEDFHDEGKSEDAEFYEDEDVGYIDSDEDEEADGEPFEFLDSDDLELENDEDEDRVYDAEFDERPDLNDTQTIETLSRLMLTPPKTIDNRPVNLWPRVMKGRPFDHELFNGQQGKRQATINFLHAVLSHNKSADVYMMSQENSSWINEDPIFADLWSGSLQAMARLGHKIHIIHTTEGTHDELSSIIQSFMPLYASGRLSSYYRKNHSRDLSLPTIFVARGICAVVSYCSTGQKNSENTVLYKNEWDTGIYADLFNTYLDDSRLLVSSCSRRGMRAYAEQVAIFEHGAGDRTLLKNSLSGLWLSEQTLYKYMSRQLPPNEISFLLDMFARRRENYENMIGAHKWVELIPKIIVDTIGQNGTCKLPGNELFCPDDVTLDGEDLKVYLSRILELLKKHENFEVILLDDIPMKMNMMLLRRKSACFTAAPDPRNPTAVLIGEEAFLGSMAKYFDDISSVAPKDKQKQETIAEIENALAALSERP